MSKMNDTTYDTPTRSNPTPETQRLVVGILMRNPKWRQEVVEKYGESLESMFTTPEALRLLRVVMDYPGKAYPSQIDPLVPDLQETKWSPLNVWDTVAVDSIQQFWPTIDLLHQYAESKGRNKTATTSTERAVIGVLMNSPHFRKKITEKFNGKFEEYLFHGESKRLFRAAMSIEDAMAWPSMMDPLVPDLVNTNWSPGRVWDEVGFDAIEKFWTNVEHVRQYAERRKLNKLLQDAQKKLVSGIDFDKTFNEFSDRLADFKDSRPASVAASPYATQFKTMADAMTYVPTKAYIVKDFFPPASLSMVYAPPGDLKSMFLMDMAVCVAAGKPFATSLPNSDTFSGFPVTQGPVVWFDKDNGIDVMMERFAAFGKAHNAPDAPVYFTAFPKPDIKAANGLEQIAAAIRETKAVLVIFDNLLRIAGVDDENSSEMDKAMSALRWVAEDTRAAVVVIHHSRKDATGRNGDKVRGHSSILGSLDAAYMVERKDGSDEITVQEGKQRRKKGVPTTFLWTYEAEGEVLKAGRFYALSETDKLKAKARREGDELEKLKDEVVALLKQRGEPMDTDEIRVALGKAKKTVTDALGALLVDRRVSLEKEGTKKLYSVK